MHEICVDIRMASYSGIGTYLTNLIRRLVQTGSFKMTLIHLPGCQFAESLIEDENVTCIHCDAPIYSIAEQFWLKKLIPKETKLFWSPHYNIPLFYKGRLLVTVHDVFHLAMPHFTKGLHKRAYARFMFQALSKKADSVITVSEFTARELVRLTGIDQSNISVVHNGVDDVWFEKKNSKSLHGRPYVVYVGNIKPHKNLKKLVRAFNQIKNKVVQDLIIIGSGEGLITGDREVEKLAGSLKDRVHFTGHVNEEQLRQYVSGADLMIFPSLYEGFGLPPLEAMASGTPVVTSETASMPEVCGDAALYFDPQSIESISEKILQVLKDKNIQADLSQRGIQHARGFSWDKCAGKTATVINNCLR